MIYGGGSQGGDMPDKVAKVKLYRARASEMRALALSTVDQEQRQTIMDVATDFELLALELEVIIAARGLG